MHLLIFHLVFELLFILLKLYNALVTKVLKLNGRHLIKLVC